MKHGTLLAAAVLVGLPEQPAAGVPEAHFTKSVAERGAIADKSNIANAAPSVPAKIEFQSLDRTKFATEFEQVELLGQGAFGQVWRCLHKELGFECAIKIVRFKASSDEPVSSCDAMREAHALHALSHRHIVQIDDAWVEPDLEIHAIDACIRTLEEPWRVKAQVTNVSYDTASGASGSDIAFECSEQDIEDIQEKHVTTHELSASLIKQQCASLPATSVNSVMYIQTELCQQNTLSNWIDKRNALVCKTGLTYNEVCDAIRIADQCAVALDHVHLSSWVHRDVKPSNIFFSLHGDVRLGDMGLAKQIHASGLTAKSGTDAGKVGTPLYAAPEQSLGKDVGTAADIYSFGLVLLELLCPVATNMERVNMVHNLRENRKVPPSLAAVSPELSLLVTSMTDSSPYLRPRAQDVRLSLTAWLAGQLSLAPVWRSIEKPTFV